MTQPGKLVLILHSHRAVCYALNVLAGALEASPRLAGLTVRFVHGSAGLRRTLERVLRRRQRVAVAWSFFSTEFAAHAAELRELRQRFDSAQLFHVAGGAHATAAPEQTLKAGFDCVVQGEGEQVVRDLLKRLLSGSDPAGLPGVAFMRSGRLVSAGLADRIDLNVFPAFSVRHGKYNPIEITRGCIYSCKFCQTPFVFKARFRHRSVEQVCRQVEALKEAELTDVRFISPTSLSYGSTDTSVRLEKVEELLDAVRRTLGNQGRIFLGSFPSEVRPEHVTPPALRVLKRHVANKTLVIGGQSGSQRMLDECHRGHSVEAIVAAVRYAREAGFQAQVDLIFGFPGETEADLTATLKLARRLASFGARMHAHTFMPLPGTPWKNAVVGPPSQAVLRALGRMAAEGELYGQWKGQLALAQTLARSRSAVSH